MPQYVDTTEVPEGNYTLDIRGGISYNLDTTIIVKTSVKATENNVIVNKTVTGNAVSHKTIALNTYNAQDGFVISEYSSPEHSLLKESNMLMISISK